MKRTQAEITFSAFLQLDDRTDDIDNIGSGTDFFYFLRRNSQGKRDNLEMFRNRTVRLIKGKKRVRMKQDEKRLILFRGLRILTKYFSEIPMPKTDKRVDAYINKSAEFAKPILKHIRKLVHAAVPDVEETMKWSFPHFDYNGSMMCSMAAFKEHASFGFWKYQLLKDTKGYLQERSSKGGEGMGNLGRITSMKGLPPDSVILDLIAQAKRLNDEGIKLPPRPKSHTRKELIVPEYFLKSLRKDKKALATFESFSYSHTKEYIEWITEAKTDETRSRRITTAIEWLSEGKPRNWKYMKK